VCRSIVDHRHPRRQPRRSQPIRQCVSRYPLRWDHTGLLVNLQSHYLIVEYVHAAAMSDGSSQIVDRRLAAVRRPG